MLFTIKTFAEFRPALIALILSVAFQSLYGQGQTAPFAAPPIQKLIGPSAVQPNSTHTYYFDNGSLHTNPNWYINGGTLNSSGRTGTQYWVQIKWGSEGTGMAVFRSELIILGDLTVTIGSPVPVAPPMPTIANHPGFTRLTRGQPAAGETYYWQDAPTGTSTSISSQYVDRMSGTTYYIRSYRASGGNWSPATAVSYTVGPIMAPSPPTITNFPGHTRLTRGNPPSFVTWYWQDAPSGTSTSNSALYVDRTTGTDYYLRAYVATINQWGPATMVSYSILPLPLALSNENYIYTIAPRVGTTDVATLADEDKIESVTYFDGLGRAMQGVGIRSGGNGEDIVTHIGYDVFGRQDRDYLPYSKTAGHGLYRPDAMVATNSHYLATRYNADIDANAPNPYSEKEFEASPLNRVLKQAAPGRDWHLGGGNEIGFEYGANATADQVRLYKVSLAYADRTYTPTLMLGSGSAAHYAPGELYRTITKAENWTSSKAHTSEEFTDKQGRTVLKRSYGDSKVGGTTVANAPHDTYYVYDDYGNLSYVLPPKMEPSMAVLATVRVQLDELGYQYKYDHRNRLVEKKIAGKGWEYIVYNKLNHPILTQDANQRLQNQWLFTKYETFGRVAYTGVFSSPSTRSVLQTAADGTGPQYVAQSASQTSVGGTNVYYSGDASVYPTTGITELHTINYYDHYVDVGAGISETSGGVTPTTNVKGLATVGKVRVLDVSPVKWITTVSYYDTKSRPIYVYSRNDYLETTDKVKSKLDFVGNVEVAITTHEKTGHAAIKTTDTYTYDHAGRPKSHKQKIDTRPEELIVLNRYDDLGQLENKKVGGAVASAIGNSPGLQSVHYAYNIRGWLKQINDPSGMGTDLFAFRINYNTVGHGGTKLFNGNISETEWRTANADNSLHWYRYDYDALNRLKKATDNLGKFNESLNYDKNGNITDLVRLGHIVGGTTVPNIANSQHFGVMDNLTYSYASNSNKLVKVADSANKIYGFKDGANTGNDYAYDVNGNMVLDANKGISTIAYNYLNLPRLLSFGNGNISYIYDATGNKLEKKVTEGSTITKTFYGGNYVYEKVNTNTDALKFFNHPEGYVDAENGFDYVYQYKDHLGNIRLSYKNVSQSGPPSLQIVEESNYYPFGLEHKGYNNIVNGTKHKWKFQNQELSEELDYNMYEYKYRHYDSSMGRFMSIDPLAHSYVYNSTYAFQENKLGLGTEVEGKEMQLHDWLVREGATYAAKELDKRMNDAGMNKTEKSVASKELYKMYKLKKSGNREKAENFAYNSGLPGLEDGPADAFRHSLFNALNTQTVGKSFTKELGDAHEEDSPTQKKSAKKMDLHNNAVGREVGEDNSDASIMDIATKLLDKMADGELVTIDSKGNVTKSTLSIKDKASILKNLQKLNGNGLTPKQQTQEDKKKKSNY